VALIFRTRSSDRSEYSSAWFHKFIPEVETNMKRLLFAGFVSVLLFTISAMSQEVRNEVSVQGTGLFTKDTNGNGTSRTTTNTGGLLVGYRYHFNHWVSAEANYGFDRDTQKYFSNLGSSRVQSDIHTATADAVVNLPLSISKFSPYVLGGGGSLVFHPTGNRGSIPSADTQAKGAFLYGVGANYTLTRHFSLRGEYRGFVYKDPDFGIKGFNTDTWTHTAQPSAGVVYRF
jgi:opacity protein-like surface antigen